VEHGAFLLLLIALAGALALAVAPRLLGYSTLVVQGGSMGQSIPNGSLVFARHVAAEDVRLGDVILVQEEGDGGTSRPRLHRVAWLDRQGGQILVQTKGDANESPDPKVYILPERVVTPAHALPYLGYLVGFVATPMGWLLLVALPATVACVATLWSIWAPRWGRQPRRA